MSRKAPPLVKDTSNATAEPPRGVSPPSTVAAIEKKKNAAIAASRADARKQARELLEGALAQRGGGGHVAEGVAASDVSSSSWIKHAAASDASPQKGGRPGSPMLLAGGGLEPLDTSIANRDDALAASMLFSPSGQPNRSKVVHVSAKDAADRALQKVQLLVQFLNLQTADDDLRDVRFFSNQMMKCGRGSAASSDGNHRQVLTEENLFSAMSKYMPRSNGLRPSEFFHSSLDQIDSIIHTVREIEGNAPSYASIDEDEAEAIRDMEALLKRRIDSLKLCACRQHLDETVAMAQKQARSEMRDECTRAFARTVGSVTGMIKLLEAQVDDRDHTLRDQTRVLQESNLRMSNAQREIEDLQQQLKDAEEQFRHASSSATAAPVTGGLSKADKQFFEREQRLAAAAKKHKNLPIELVLKKEFRHDTTMLPQDMSMTAKWAKKFMRRQAKLEFLECRVATLERERMSLADVDAKPPPVSVGVQTLSEDQVIGTREWAAKFSRVTNQPTGGAGGAAAGGGASSSNAAARVGGFNVGVPQGPRPIAASVFNVPKELSGASIGDGNPVLRAASQVMSAVKDTVVQLDQCRISMVTELLDLVDTKLFSRAVSVVSAWESQFKSTIADGVDGMRVHWQAVGSVGASAANASQRWAPAAAAPSQAADLRQGTPVKEARAATVDTAGPSSPPPAALAAPLLPSSEDAAQEVAVAECLKPVTAAVNDVCRAISQRFAGAEFNAPRPNASPGAALAFRISDAFLLFMQRSQAAPMETAVCQTDPQVGDQVHSVLETSSVGTVTEAVIGDQVTLTPDDFGYLADSVAECGRDVQALERALRARFKMPQQDAGKLPMEPYTGVEDMVEALGVSSQLLQYLSRAVPRVALPQAAAMTTAAVSDIGDAKATGGAAAAAIKRRQSSLSRSQLQNGAPPNGATNASTKAPAASGGHRSGSKPDLGAQGTRGKPGTNPSESPAGGALPDTVGAPVATPCPKCGWVGEDTDGLAPRRATGRFFQPLRALAPQPEPPAAAIPPGPVARSPASVPLLPPSIPAAPSPQPSTTSKLLAALAQTAVEMTPPERSPQITPRAAAAARSVTPPPPQLRIRMTDAVRGMTVVIGDALRHLIDFAATPPDRRLRFPVVQSDLLDATRRLSSSFSTDAGLSGGAYPAALSLEGVADRIDEMAGIMKTLNGVLQDVAPEPLGLALSPAVQVAPLAEADKPLPAPPAATRQVIHPPAALADAAQVQADLDRVCSEALKLSKAVFKGFRMSERDVPELFVRVLDRPGTHCLVKEALGLMAALSWQLSARSSISSGSFAPADASATDRPALVNEPAPSVTHDVLRPSQPGSTDLAVAQHRIVVLEGVMGAAEKKAAELLVDNQSLRDKNIDLRRELEALQKHPMFARLQRSKSTLGFAPPAPTPDGTAAVPDQQQDDHSDKMRRRGTMLPRSIGAASQRDTTIVTGSDIVAVRDAHPPPPPPCAIHERKADAPPSIVRTAATPAVMGAPAMPTGAAPRPAGERPPQRSATPPGTGGGSAAATLVRKPPPSTPAAPQPSTTHRRPLAEPVVDLSAIVHVDTDLFDIIDALTPEERAVAVHRFIGVELLTLHRRIMDAVSRIYRRLNVPAFAHVDALREHDAQQLAAGAGQAAAMLPDLKLVVASDTSTLEAVVDLLERDSVTAVAKIKNAFARAQLHLQVQRLKQEREARRALLAAQAHEQHEAARDADKALLHFLERQERHLEERRQWLLHQRESISSQQRHQLQEHKGPARTPLSMRPLIVVSPLSMLGADSRGMVTGAAGGGDAPPGQLSALRPVEPISQRHPGVKLSGNATKKDDEAYAAMFMDRVHAWMKRSAKGGELQRHGWLKSRGAAPSSGVATPGFADVFPTTPLPSVTRSQRLQQLLHAAAVGGASDAPLHNATTAAPSAGDPIVGSGVKSLQQAVSPRVINAAVLSRNLLVASGGPFSASGGDGVASQFGKRGFSTPPVAFARGTAESVAVFVGTPQVAASTGPRDPIHLTTSPPLLSPHPRLLPAVEVPTTPHADSNGDVSPHAREGALPPASTRRVNAAVSVGPVPRSQAQLATLAMREHMLALRQQGGSLTPPSATWAAP